METKFYTYLHRRCDTDAVFYIGKGHGDRAYSSSRNNRWWRHIADSRGFDVEIFAQGFTEKTAFYFERFLIACYRAGGAELVNQTDGGEGFSGGRHTPESRAQIAEAGRGRVFSEEARAKISQKQTGENNHRWQTPPPQKGKTKAEFPNLSRSGAKKGNVPWNKGQKGTGAAHPVSRPFCTPMGEHVSRDAAAVAHGISTQALYCRSKRWPDQYYYLDKVFNG